ncbi:type III-B CRISPR module RAMP protein Cmr1 [Candidatus Viridilinea mediisalina]|nr:type III-B CRISPR module RAMP protein Cmr1 [Candidatus Viridilinea mediisalina]
MRTLTPLWTGGVETGRVDRLHETGLLGSMRWWMEVLVRGLGGTACDLSEATCRFDSEGYNRSSANDEPQRLRDAGLCDVCQLFGATGWRRRFRIEVLDDQTRPIWEGNTPLNIRPPDRTRGWFLSPGLMGTFTLRIQGDQVSLGQLAALLLFMERWGNLGARAQLGYGAFALEDREILARIAGWSDISSTVAFQDTNQVHKRLPNLQYFGFFRYRFRPQQSGWWARLPGFERVVARIRPLVESYQTVPLVPVLRNSWRFQSWQREWGDAGRFWGMLGQERIRSKVQISWAYPRDGMWELHGSAWLHAVQAVPVWAMLSNVAHWNQMLGVEGELETFPSGPWQPWSAATVRTFLEQTIHL